MRMATRAALPLWPPQPSPSGGGEMNDWSPAAAAQGRAGTGAEQD